MSEAPVQAPVVAQANGAAAVQSYHDQVAQLQKIIPQMQANLTAAENKLADLLANPVLLHA